MLYCKKCQYIYEGSACPICGKSKGSEPENDDPCYLVEKEIIWADMLKNVLDDNNIPYITKGRLGAAMSVNLGSMFERERFYVPYACLSAAQDIVISLFGNTEA